MVIYVDVFLLLMFLAGNGHKPSGPSQAKITEADC